MKTQPHQQPRQLIAYIRVSTEEQGTSRNGMEAQREEILRFANINGFDVVEIVEEVASGKLGLGDRPILQAAILKANKLKCAVVVSKLDRLSRHAAFILNLMDSKVRFIVAELGEGVDNFMLHIYAVVAQKEREMISQRTSAALQRLKASGKVLGNRTNIREAQAKGAKANAILADEWAQRMKPSIERMLRAGMSMNSVAEELNMQKMATRNGGQWTAKTISNLAARWR